MWQLLSLMLLFLSRPFLALTLLLLASINACVTMGAPNAMNRLIIVACASIDNNNHNISHKNDLDNDKNDDKIC